MPAAAWLVVSLLGLPPMESVILILFFALPCAPTAYVLARQYDGDAHLMAGSITLQTLLAMSVLPALLLLVLYPGRLLRHRQLLGDDRHLLGGPGYQLPGERFAGLAIGGHHAVDLGVVYRLFHLEMATQVDAPAFRIDQSGIHLDNDSGGAIESEIEAAQVGVQVDVRMQRMLV